MHEPKGHQLLNSTLIRVVVVGLVAPVVEVVLREGNVADCRSHVHATVTLTVKKWRSCRRTSSGVDAAPLGASTAPM